MKKILELDKKDFFDKSIESPLRKMSDPIVTFDEKLKEIIFQMKEVFYSYKISVGLAAPQIGINKRVIMVNLNKDQNDDLILINPKIVSNTGKTKESYESCLSVPKFKGKVKRKDKVSIEYFDENGIINNLEASGFLCRVIQHEIDHINGVLFVDRIGVQSNLEKIDFEWE